MKYEVFARANSGDDLAHVGRVEAPNDRLARSYAYRTYDEEDWEQMAVVRREHLLAVGPPADGPVDRPTGGGQS